MSNSDSEQAAGAEEGFLSRWSQRKHTANKGDLEAAADATTGAAEAVDTEHAAETDAIEDELPSDSDMPPVESLDEDSDYSGFMSPKVSDELRNLALRKLFHSSSFNVRDGLDDYDDDFTSFEKLGDIVTADMRYQMELAQEALEGSESAAGEATADADDEGDYSAVQVAAVEQGAEADAGQEPLAGEHEQHAEERRIDKEIVDKEIIEEGNVKQDK